MKSWVLLGDSRYEVRPSCSFSSPGRKVYELWLHGSVIGEIVIDDRQSEHIVIETIPVGGSKHTAWYWQVKSGNRLLADGYQPTSHDAIMAGRICAKAEGWI